MTSNIFKNRQQAGEMLAGRLLRYAGEKPAVFALTPGGAAVAGKIAETLNAPLDTLVVRNLTAPENPDLVVGAIAPGDVIVVDRVVQRVAGISNAELERLMNHEAAEMNRIMQAYQSGSYARHASNRTVIIADDGIAPMLAIRAAAAAAKVLYGEQPKTIFATPVLSKRELAEVEQIMDEAVCLSSPDHLTAIANWYEEFKNVTEREMAAWLKSVNRLMLGFV